MALCIDAINCSSSGVLQECYEENNFEDDMFFCDCSNWFGWVGENCDVPTATVYYFGVSYFFFLLWTFFNIATLGRVLLLFIQTKNVKGRDTNPVFFVALLAFLGSVCLLSRFFIRSKGIFDSTYFEVLDSSSLIFSSTSVQRRFVSVDTLFFAGGWVIQGLACLQMIVSWLDIFQQIDQVFPLHRTISDRSLKIIISSIMIFVCFVFLVFTALNAVVEIMIGYALLSIILAVSFLVGYWRFKNGLNELVQGNLGTQEKIAINLVRTAFRVNGISFSVIAICTLIYYYGITNYLRILKIGGFNYFFVVLDIALFFGYSTATYASYYSFTVALRIIKTSSDMTWCPLFNSHCQKHKIRKTLSTQ